MRPVAAALALLLGLATPAAANSPYAGMADRPLRALSEQQQAELLAGHGMGMALAAELNGWPGPMHVLELAAPLSLTPEQRGATEALMAAMRSEAQRLGARIVAAERELDAAFRDRSITPAALDSATAGIGALQAALRAVHLRAHLAQAALLTPDQIAAYDRLRGYAAPAGGPAPARPEGHRHRH
jgi:hypothetical protein